MCVLVGVIDTVLFKAPAVSLSKKLYPLCLVLVGSKKGLKRDFTIQTKIKLSIL